MSEETMVDALKLINSMSKYLDDEDYMEEQFKNKFSIWKKDLSVLTALVKGEVPGALFEVGEYALKSETLVKIDSRSFTKTRGWVYSISYMKIDKSKLTVSCGGSSCWWDEGDLKKLEDPLSKLIIQKHKLEQKHREKEVELKQTKSEIGKINYSLNVIMDSRP